MTDRSGCGLAELTLLQVVDELSSASGRNIRLAEVLGEVDERIGLGPNYGYQMICDLVRPWVIPVALLTISGSPGDRIFPQPTPVAHAGCRLSRAGELVVAAEAGAIAPVPAGLINGTWWRGAARPPLDAFSVIAALRKLIEEPELTDDQLRRIAGHPVSLTGSELTGDFEALAHGEATTIREMARITRADAAAPPAPDRPASQPPGPSALAEATGQSQKPVHLIIDAVPRHLTAPQLWNEISEQIRPEGWQPPQPPPGIRQPAGVREQMIARALPIAHMRDHSEENNIRLEITLRPGADPPTVQAQLAGLDKLGTDLAAQYPAPLADMLRSWVATNRYQGITASLDQFEAAVRADRVAYQSD